jgi:hypothetical protein
LRGGSGATGLAPECDFTINSDLQQLKNFQNFPQPQKWCQTLNYNKELEDFEEYA